MLSYRSDLGIPGYTGYTPGFATVPVPINGSNIHTGTTEQLARVGHRMGKPDTQDILKTDLQSSGSYWKLHEAHDITSSS
jgi:hypothetical protein